MIVNSRHQAGVVRLIIALLFPFVLPTGTTSGQALADKIDRYVQQRLAKSSIPGLAIAVVHKDTLVLAKGYGVTSANAPVTATTPFAIASLSKAFTAMAIIQLANAGQLALDAPVVTYLPSFAPADPRGRSITVRQLLHQTSGLADTGFPELAVRNQPNTLIEATAQLTSAHLVSEPGKQFHYHNPNYRLLAAIVEAVSREPFADYLQKHIFIPLQMRNTSDVATTNALYSGSGRVANGHIFVAGHPVAFQEPDWFIDGAAGMRSSVTDMAHWLSLQLSGGQYHGKRLVSSRSMDLMHSVPPGTSLHYGMGWVVDNDANLHHSGILWTYSAEQLLLTKDGYGVVILFNSGINAYLDYNSFLRDISSLLIGQEPDIPTLPDWFLPLFIDIILLILIGLTVRRLTQLRQWHRTHTQQPVWRTWLSLLLRLMPFVVFLLIPYLLTALSGRVLGWDRIFLMLPDGIVGFGLIALLNLLLVGFQVRTYRASDNNH